MRIDNVSSKETQPGVNFLSTSPRLKNKKAKCRLQMSSLSSTSSPPYLSLNSKKGTFQPGSLPSQSYPPRGAKDPPKGHIPLNIVWSQKASLTLECPGAPWSNSGNQLCADTTRHLFKVTENDDRSDCGKETAPILMPDPTV